MKFTLNDVKNVIEPQCKFFDGKPMIWIEKIWSIVEKYNLNKIDTYYERIHIYCLIYGICCIYSFFVDKIMGFPDDDDKYMDFEINYEDLIEENEFDDIDSIKDYLNYIIMKSENANEIFELIKKELNVSETFALLYYASNYSMFSLREYETDEYYYSDCDENEIEYNADYEFRKLYANNEEERNNAILNDVSVDKMVAYEWLNDCMR